MNDNDPTSRTRDPEPGDPSWPPHPADCLTQLYNRTFEHVNCEQGFSDEEAHRDACLAVQKTGAPAPIMMRPSAVDQTTGMSRGEITDRLAAETIRRAVYEGAIRNLYAVVGDTTFETEDDPAQAALTEVYNICNFAIPGINGEQPEDDEEDGLICVQQEGYRKLAHDAPHDDLAGDLIFFSERNRKLARAADKKCSEAQVRREEAFRERDTALRDASRLRRKLDKQCSRVEMLERGFDSVYTLLCSLESELGDKVTKKEARILLRSIENCKYWKEPEFSIRFGNPAPDCEDQADDVALAVRREAEARGPLPASVIGCWPGDETDEELLDELDGKHKEGEGGSP